MRLPLGKDAAFEQVVILATGKRAEYQHPGRDRHEAQTRHLPAQQLAGVVSPLIVQVQHPAAAGDVAHKAEHEYPWRDAGQRRTSGRGERILAGATGQQAPKQINRCRPRRSAQPRGGPRRPGGRRPSRW